MIGNTNEPALASTSTTATDKTTKAWQATAAGELRVFDAGMCLDAVGEDIITQVDVQIWPCHGGINQKWAINADGSITGVQSGLCLDVKGEATHNSAPVQLYTCTGRNN